MKSTILLSLTALAVACGTANAGTINLVVNGSFEQGLSNIGSFQGWQTNLGDLSTFVDSDGQTGTMFGDATDGIWSAWFGSTAADGGASISQDLATTANHVYVLSFDLANDNGGTAPVNSFVISLGGAPVFTFSNLADQNYVHEQRAFVASGSLMSLEFSGSNDQSYFDLDNVAVTAAPEPSAFSAMAVGLLLLFAALSKRLTVAR